MVFQQLQASLAGALLVKLASRCLVGVREDTLRKLVSSLAFTVEGSQSTQREKGTAALPYGQESLNFGFGQTSWCQGKRLCRHQAGDCLTHVLVGYLGTSNSIPQVVLPCLPQKAKSISLRVPYLAMRMQASRVLRTIEYWVSLTQIAQYHP